MIEHRKRQRLSHLNELSQIPVLPKKPIQKRKRRPNSMLTTSNGSLAPPSSSMTNLRPKIIVEEIDSNGNSDPLPRRKRSSTFSTVPPLPPPRKSISHSKSLTTVSLNNHKICTEV